MTLKSIIDKYKSHATTVVWLTALIVTAGVLLGYERHVLWRIQEQNLFLDTILFFQQQMVLPDSVNRHIGQLLLGKGQGAMAEQFGRFLFGFRKQVYFCVLQQWLAQTRTVL